MKIAAKPQKGHRQLKYTTWTFKDLIDVNTWRFSLGDVVLIFYCISSILYQVSEVSFCRTKGTELYHPIVDSIQPFVSTANCWRRKGIIVFQVEGKFLKYVNSAFCFNTKLFKTKLYHLPPLYTFSLRGALTCNFWSCVLIKHFKI